MTVDLKLGIHNRYSIVTLIFFIPYVLFQPPATVIMRKIGPRIFLSAITMVWGGTMIVGSSTLQKRHCLSYITRAQSHVLIYAHRALVLSPTGKDYSDFVYFSASSKPVSSPAVHIS